MSNFHKRTFFASSLAVLGFALAPAPAQAATTCNATTDCAKGYLCTVVGGSTCATAAPCPPGAECAATPDCAPTEIKECRPGATCTVDADCADDLKCITNMSRACSGGASCSKDGTCTSTPTTCTTVTTSSCFPRYIAPCTVDADCGDGFRCVAEQNCSCWASGSAGTGGSATGGGVAGVPTPSATDDGAGGTTSSAPERAVAPAEPAPDSSSGCSCSDTGTMRCKAIEKDCTDASECPSGWTCEQTANVACGSVAPTPTERSIPIPTDDGDPSAPVGSSGAGGSATVAAGGGGSPIATPRSSAPPGAGASSSAGGGASASVGTGASSSVGTGASASLGAGASSSGADVPTPSCPPPPSKQCVPPNYHEYGTGTLGGKETPRASGEGAQGVPVPVANGDNQLDSTGHDGSSSTPTGGATVGAPPADADDSVEESGSKLPTEPRGGISCHVGQVVPNATTGFGAVWLALLGLAGLASRRRAASRY